MKIFAEQKNLINKESNKYEWLKTSRFLMLDSYNPPFYPDLEFEIDRFVKMMKCSEANTVRVPAVGFFANYPSQHYPVSSVLDNRDILQEVDTVCKEHGFHWIPYFPSLQFRSSWIAEKYPDWAVRTPDGEIFSWWHALGRDTPSIAVLCVNTGACQLVIDSVLEVLNNYQPDGIYFDGPVLSSGLFLNSFCHCETCKKLFREETGKELPGDRVYDWSKQVSVIHLQWYRNKIEQFMQEVYQVIKRHRDIPVLFHWGDHQIGTSSRGSKITDYGDGLLLEPGDDYSLQINKCKLAHSLGKIVLGYVGSFNQYPRFSLGSMENQIEAFSVLAVKGTPLIASAPSCYYNQEDCDKVKVIFSFVKENEELIQGLKIVKEIGFPYSFSSSDWHIRRREEVVSNGYAWREERDNIGMERDFVGDKVGFYNCYYRGMGNFLTNAHLQHYVVPEKNLSDAEKISEFPVICLANVACLSENQGETIKRYVENGGCLLATHETSLYDEWGNKRKNFLLHELFGCDAKGYDGRLFEKYLVFENKPPKILQSFAGRYFPAGEFVITRGRPEAQVLATVVLGKDKTIAPGIYYNEYGRGRVIYLASGLERQYGMGIGDHRSRNPEIFTILKTMFDLLTDQNYVVKTNANRGIITNLLEKENHLVLYLINTNAATKEPTNAEQTYIIPVEDIECEVQIPQGKRVRKVYELMSRGKISVDTIQSRIHFRLSLLKVCSVVVIEMDKEKG